jgi:hypothetical protein
MNASYRNVWENKFQNQPEAILKDLDYFAQLILSTDLKIYQRISYAACFLYRLGPLGYFNTDREGLYFGFYWGKLLLDKPSSEILEIDDRKMVKLVRLSNKRSDEAFQGNFLLLLDEALKIDDLKYGKKS